MMCKIKKERLVLLLAFVLLLNASCAPQLRPLELEEHEYVAEQEESNSVKLEPDVDDARAKEERICEIEAILENPDLILVNRDHRLPSDYEPDDLVPFGNGYRIKRICAEQLEKMMAAGKEAGYTYVLRSGYRSYSVQAEIYYNKVGYYKRRGYSEEEAIEQANRYNAPPGASEHQTGYAVDVCIPSILEKYEELHVSYGETKEFEWFSSHAHEYGFIMRYGKGQEEITGYAFEPWHYRYVGVELATKFHALGITYEEFLEGLEAELEALKN